MNNKTDSRITQLVKELDSAVLRGDDEKSGEITDILFRLQGGSEEDTVLPVLFAARIASRPKAGTGGRRARSKRFKRMLSIAAAAVLVMTLGVTALATRFFGLRDMVIKSDLPAITDSGTAAGAAAGTETAPPAEGQDSPEPDYELIPLQGYPDSNEYKASAEWELFRQNYDTDGSIISQVGNNPNEYTEKYPAYLVYSKEMADKLEEIIAKYGLKLHTSTITIAESTEDLLRLAGVENFIKSGGSGGVNRVYGGYAYDEWGRHRIPVQE